jgi:hypothetical protein
MIVSLLASDPKRDDAFGRQLLSDMANILGRKEDEPFMPVGTDDVAEILCRRLLDPETTNDPDTFKPSVQEVVRALSALDPEFAKTPKQRDEREKQYLASFPFDAPSEMARLFSRLAFGTAYSQHRRSRRLSKAAASTGSSSLPRKN